MTQATTWFGEALERLGDAPVIRAMPPLILALALFRIPAAMPEYYLDGSWRLALNAAVASGIPFGKGIAFTFGPASSLLTEAYHPRTVWLTLAVAAALSAGASWLLRRRLREDSPWALLCLSGVLLGADREASLVVLPACLVMGLVGYPLTGARTARSPAYSLSEPIVAAGLVGILLAVKGTFLPLGVFSVAALAVLAQRRDSLASLLVPLAAIVGFGATWFSYGQAMTDVPSYLRSIVSVAAGYSEAMQAGWTGTTLGAASAYLLGACICAVMFASLVERRIGAWLAGAVVSVTVFTLLKLGFVRADHMRIAIGGLAAMAVLILPRASRVLRSAIVLMSLLSATVIGMKVSWSTLMEGLPIHQMRTLGDHGRAWGAFTSPDEDLSSGFEARLAEAAWQHPLPALRGTVDIYSHDQMRVIASGLDWDPRPIFQSYSAYAPDLAERNAEHLQSPSGPDWVVFAPSPIDGRYPSSEDGPSWLELLRRYDVSDSVGDALILRRTPSDRGLISLGGSSTSGRLDERIEVDVSGAIVYVQIDADPSWLGSLALLGFRSAPLYVWVELSSGEEGIYRLPMGLAEAGFILSPFVGDQQQVTTLFASPPGGSIPGLPRVTAFRVITERPELWQSRFAVRWQSFDRG